MFKMKPDTAENYRRLFGDPDLQYGVASADRCPGVRYLAAYEHWICSPVVDFGSGSGDTVKELRARGYDARGYDWVKAPGCEVQDLTEPFKIKRAASLICIDVLEHIAADKLPAVMENICRAAGRHVIQVHSSSSMENGIELHVTQWPLSQWLNFLSEYLEVVRFQQISSARFMFFCKAKKRAAG